jgi:uncharacterized protein
MADSTPLPIRFPSGDGHCAGDLYLPVAPEESGARSAEAGPPPVVVMAHGIGAERSFGLAPFARAFAARGMAVLVFDYRHFGDSPGTPRYLVSPRRQVEDYLAALAFVRQDLRLDGDRIGLWGTSFSGGHVLVAAARKPAGLRGVVSQIPFVSGLASTLAYPLRYHVPAVALGLADAARGLLGPPPLTVAVVRERGLALLASPDSHAGYMAIVEPSAEWPGRVPARVFLEILRYHPGRRAPEVEVPTLLLGASRDAICPMGATRRVARRLPRGELREFPIGHFDAYHGEWFRRLSEAAGDFLETTLLK